MNQVTNLIQWKNLTEEQKADFDFENYKYKAQTANGWEDYSSFTYLSSDSVVTQREQLVFRLFIEEDKWYFCEGVYKKPILGKDLYCEDFNVFSENLRPAKPHEIPVKEKTLPERIQEKWPDKEVVMLEFDANDCLQFASGHYLGQIHCTAQSMKGFFRYVYEYGDGELTLFHEPLDVLDDKTIQPIAVLFEAKK